MILYDTPEMTELKKIFEPYQEGCHLVDNAPNEAIIAEKKYMQLSRKQTEDEINSWFE